MINALSPLEGLTTVSVGTRDDDQTERVSRKRRFKRKKKKDFKEIGLWW